MKTLPISNVGRKILYLSRCWVGKTHDFKLLKLEFPPEQDWFKNFVEHAIGGMKRYRILADRLRLHDFDFYNDVLEVCAGLWNFQLSH